MKLNSLNFSNKQWISLGALFVLSLLLRWYRLPEYLFFGFEQGRDAFIAQNIATGIDLVFVGPKTDIAGVFHGPWYYYLLGFIHLIGGKNPLFSAFLLVSLSSLVPSLVTVFFYRISKKWGLSLVVGFLSVISFDLITYSRWLSNVTLTPLFFLITIWVWWEYLKSKKSEYFILGLGLAGLTSQFEIILTLWFFWAGIILFATKTWVVPSMKTFVQGVLAAAFWYIPLLLFNIKNDWITIHSIKAYLTQSENAGFSLQSLGGNILAYADQLEKVIGRTLLSHSTQWTPLVLLIIAGGLLLLPKHLPKLTPTRNFFISLMIMAFPVIFFPKSLSLDQLYVGTALPIIVLTGLSLLSWWKSSGKAPTFLLIALLLMHLPLTLKKIQNNQGFFFITIQEGMEYRYQQEIFKYILTEQQAEPYRLKAFTIPYYQEEGWQYLNNFFNPTFSDHEAKVIYVIIEKQVEPYWEQQWLKDLGKTQLLEEKNFGVLRVQKHQIAS